MAWSIFNQGGGKGVAATWADRLLSAEGAPQSAGNEQFVYDWEVSEGGGGLYNPLNQGPVPGHPELTSTGSQFGGGAADYVSWDAGLTGAVDYLHMPQFKDIGRDLAMDNPDQARHDLILSPWAASHYGGGTSFSSEPFPGQKQALPPIGNVQTTSFSSGILGSIAGHFFNPDTLQRIGLVIFGGFLIVVGVMMMTGGKTIELITDAQKSKKKEPKKEKTNELV